MPIYEYRCESCGENFEELVPARVDDSTVPCPRCGEHHAKRKLSTFATSGGGGGGRVSSGGGGGGCGGGRGFT